MTAPQPPSHPSSPALPQAESYPRFLPDGRAPTVEDMHRLATFNPAVHTALSLHQNGELTWEQFLITAALALADINYHLQRCLLDATVRQRTVYLNVRGGPDAPG